MEEWFTAVEWPPRKTPEPPPMPPSEMPVGVDQLELPEPPPTAATPSVTPMQFSQPEQPPRVTGPLAMGPNREPTPLHLVAVDGNPNNIVNVPTPIQPVVKAPPPGFAKQNVVARE